MRSCVTRVCARARPGSNAFKDTLHAPLDVQRIVFLGLLSVRGGGALLGLWSASGGLGADVAFPSVTNRIESR